MVEGVEGLAGELPAFNSRGYLPRGIHHATWAEFRDRFVYNEKRLWLLRGMLAAGMFLRAAGCVTLYVGGSYVTRKRKPFDIDVAWRSEEVDWDYLGRLAPVFLDPSERAAEIVEELFRGDYFPSEGIEGLSKRTFLNFIQRDRQDRFRGVVALDATKLPTSEELMR